MILRVALLATLCVVCAAFSLELDNDVMTIARSKQDAAKAIHAAKKAKELILMYFTYNLEKDGYAALYLGWLKYLFDSEKFNLRLLIVETTKERFTSITDYCLDIMPKESILVSFDHGLFARRLKELGNLKDFDRLALPSNITNGHAGSYRSIANFGIFHLNHEQPWNFKANFFHHDYHSEEELMRIYSQHGLILRNYFHEPLSANPNVLQLPVGPSFYGYWIGNSRFDKLRWDIPTAERKVRCRFIGRKTYVDMSHYSIPERDALFDMVDFESEGYQQYVEAYPMYAVHNFLTSREGFEVFPCQIYNYTINEPFNYELFMQVLVEIMFVPCPPGNNPETFRHYEVLEAGVIPLILSTPPHSGYLASPFWADYPGPLFATWAEAGHFVSTTSIEDAGKLQLKLRDWYSLFKQRIKGTVADAVLTHYPSLFKDPDNKDEVSSDEPATGSAANTGDKVTAAAEGEISLLKELVGRQEVAAEALDRQNMHLKLLLSEMRDSQKLMMDDIMTLTSGMNALLRGHSVYGERLANIEKVMGISYGPNGEGILTSDAPQLTTNNSPDARLSYNPSEHTEF